MKFKVEIIEQINFSQLFDNGNCLAYNIIEGNIDSFLNDHSKIDKNLFGEKQLVTFGGKGNALLI